MINIGTVLQIATGYLLVIAGIKIYQKPSSWPLYIHFIPLTLFINYARLFGMTTQAWQNAFIFAGLASLIVITIQNFKKIIIPRLMLGANVFFLVGASGFMFWILPILYLYKFYQSVLFFLSIFAVGIGTTFFSKAGFIGVKSSNLKQVKRTSLHLLAATFIALIWSFATVGYGIGISGAIPFILLRLLRDMLAKPFEK